MGSMDALAITKWSAKLLMDYREQLVYADMCNKNYEGEIRFAGALKIFTAPIPTVSDYVRGTTTVAYEDVNPSEQLFVVDQRKYWGIRTDDLEKQLARISVWEDTLRNGAWSMSKTVDTYVATTLAAGCPTVNVLPPRTIGGGLNANMFDLLTQMETLLEQNDVPMDDLHVALPPQALGWLRLDPRYSSFNTAEAVQQLAGKNVGRVTYMTVHKTTAVPLSGSTYTLIACSREAMTFAEQMSRMEEVPRDKDDFYDRVRSQTVYGGKVVQPKGIVKVDVQFAAM